MDGATLIPWAKGKPLALDITVPDTAYSHINFTSAEAGAVAKNAATFKESKYADNASTRLFYPVSIEIAGLYDVRAHELIDEIDRHMTKVTEDTNLISLHLQQ